MMEAMAEVDAKGVYHSQCLSSSPLSGVKLVALMYKAKKTLDVTSEELGNPTLQSQLVAAVNRGVVVRLISPLVGSFNAADSVHAPSNDGRRGSCTDLLLLVMTFCSLQLVNGATPQAQQLQNQSLALLSQVLAAYQLSWRAWIDRVLHTNSAIAPIISNSGRTK